MLLLVWIRIMLLLLCRIGAARSGLSAWQCSFQGGACAPKSPFCPPCRKPSGSCFQSLPVACKTRHTSYVLLIKTTVHVLVDRPSFKTDYAPEQQQHHHNSIAHSSCCKYALCNQELKHDMCSPNHNGYKLSAHQHTVRYSYLPYTHGQSLSPVEVHCASHVLHQAKHCWHAVSVFVHLQVIAHSMGAWTAYEFLLHARANGLAMPVKAFLSAMPHPDIPVEQRPWRQQARLDEAQFQVRTAATYF